MLSVDAFDVSVCGTNIFADNFVWNERRINMA